MRRKSFADMECPIAQALEIVGEWWTILILRDACHGLTRFDQFERSLGIAPNILSRRLSKLVADGLLEKRRDSAREDRPDYVLTARGRSIFPVLVALMEFGNGNLPPEARSVGLVRAGTGEPVDPVLMDARSGRPLDPLALDFAPGPAASTGMLRRIEFARRHAERLRKDHADGADTP